VGEKPHKLKPNRGQPPHTWKPSLLAGVLGIWHWIRHPKDAYEREKTQYRNLRAYRELKRIGCIDDFEGYPPTALPPQYDDLLNVYLTI
jgi:hypothetical protein